jgi:integrase
LVDPALSEAQKVQHIRQVGERHQRAKAEDLQLLLDYWQAQKKPKTRTILEAKAAFRLLRTVATSPTISGVTKADVIAVRDHRASTGKKASTVQKAVTLIKAAYGVALADGKFDLNVNPAAGVVVRGKRGRGRPAWTPEMLQAALDHLWLASRQSDGAAGEREGRHRAGVQESDYWLFALLVWGGMRLAEAAGLRRSDARAKPVPHVRIEETDDRGLKTEESTRDTPLHPAIAAGFLEWAAERGDRLWPRAPAASGKRLRRFLESIRGKADLHSLRHGIRTAVRAAGIPEEAANSAMGHAANNVGRRYGTYPLEALAREWAKLDLGVRMPHV